jgi:uncharacterized protein (DUF58 family)
MPEKTFIFEVMKQDWRIYIGFGGGDIKRLSVTSRHAEYAISIAASVAKVLHQQKREVGLVSTGQNYTVLPAERGERQLGKILETLAVIEPEGELPLWALVNTQANSLPGVAQ